MIILKSDNEIKILRVGGKILAKVLYEVAKTVKPGITTEELNQLAIKRLRKLKAEPSFLNYGAETGHPYPAALCTSVDDAVVHGIPNSKVVLKEGQIVGLDLGCWYEGLCTDMALTVPVGAVTSEVTNLLKVTKTALEIAIKQAKVGNKTGDIGNAVQEYVEACGFSVVRQLVGHGVGREVHEDPPVPNFGKPGTGYELKEGMVIAIEPMVNMGDYPVKNLKDGWSVVTLDGSLSAHFEHTVAITDKGPQILTLL